MRLQICKFKTFQRLLNIILTTLAEEKQLSPFWLKAYSSILFMSSTISKKIFFFQHACFEYNFCLALVVTSVDCNRTSLYLTMGGFQPVVLVLLPALLMVIVSWSLSPSHWLLTSRRRNESSTFLASARCQLWIFHIWTCCCLASRCFAFYKV